MQSYEFLLVIAIILLSTKLLGLISERVHMPQVVGALIVAQKGAQAGLVSEKMFPAIVLMVIVTTLVTPLLLKVGMKKQTPDNTELPPECQGSLPRTDYI